MATPGVTSIALIASTLLSTGHAVADVREMRSDQHHFPVKFPSGPQIRNNDLKPAVFNSASRQAVFQITSGSYDLDCGGTLQTKDVTVPRRTLRGDYRKCDQPAGVAIKSFPCPVDDHLLHAAIGGREPDVVSSDAGRIFSSFNLLPE